MSKKNSLITFKEGGWVLTLMGVILISITIWAISPAIFRVANQEPGDGRTLESYMFNLDELSIPRDVVIPSMHHRNMSPTLSNPLIWSSEMIAERNRSKRNKFLVSGDLIIGVTIGNESRAYPLHMLHVHELINDTLGGTPITVSWHWPSGHAIVHKRLIKGKICDFANSGIAGNGGMLIYPKEDSPGNEQLFSLLLNKSVTGVNQELEIVPHEVMDWKTWVEMHPETTSIAPNENFKKRYRKGDPSMYFLTDTLYFPAKPMPPIQENFKAHVLAIKSESGFSVYSIHDLVEKADEFGHLQLNIDGKPITLLTNKEPLWAAAYDENGEPMISQRALWFAWFANHPSTKIIEP